jgi:photosystem II cytochrome c550
MTFHWPFGWGKCLKSFLLPVVFRPTCKMLSLQFFSQFPGQVHSQIRWKKIRTVFFSVITVLVVITMGVDTAEAANVDPYVPRFLKVKESIDLPLNTSGETKSFSGEAITKGLRLFKANCINCHVGGNTLPDPEISLSLAALNAGKPRRDTIEGLVQFFRQPLTYDGSDVSIVCRKVPESWLPRSEAENLAAFILRAAEVAPGWATENY